MVQSARDQVVSEAAVVRACGREMDERDGCFHFNVGGQNGVTGLPDHVCFYRGIGLLIEYKRPHGGRLSARQAWVHECARKAGVRVVIARCRADVADALDQIDFESKGRAR